MLRSVSEVGELGVEEVIRGGESEGRCRVKSTVPNKTQVRLAGYSLQVNRPEL